MVSTHKAVAWSALACTTAVFILGSIDLLDGTAHVVPVAVTKVAVTVLSGVSVALLIGALR